MGPVFIGPYLHACMKDFGSGHQARPDTRLCGAFRMSITAQSRTNDVVLLATRSFAPTAQLLRRARCRQGMALSNTGACRHDTATASLDCSCARRLGETRGSGRRNGPRSNKETIPRKEMTLMGP